MVFPDLNALQETVFDAGIPDFQMPELTQTKIPESVLVDVPGDWGNNAASGRMPDLLFSGERFRSDQPQGRNSDHQLLCHGIRGSGQMLFSAMRKVFRI